MESVESQSMPSSEIDVNSSGDTHLSHAHSYASSDHHQPSLPGQTHFETLAANAQENSISKVQLSDNDSHQALETSHGDANGSKPDTLRPLLFDDETTGKPKKRRSRWDPPPSESNDGAGSDGGSGAAVKRRKSRWSDDEPKPLIQLPDFMKDFTGGIEFDPEIQALNSRLLEISRKLQSGLPLDDRPEGARSPSPEPVYDNFGIRINTREYRARERLNRERQEIISQIIKRNPAFKPPADYRPPKLQKKLYIPMKEYPGYNFIGLIIGPRGNTQKRMERETGAKIVIRGKGSLKEGRLGQKRDLKPDPSENEDLHVLVEAETQESLDAAAGMVEKLLHPVDEVLNEHKRQQLRELATLNGTIRDEEFCRLCGEPGHRQFACPSRLTTFKSDVLCKICGDGGHPTIDCPVKATTGKKMDDEYQNFLAELGGNAPESATKPSSATLALGPGTTVGSTPPWANGTTTAVGAVQSGLGSNGVKLLKEYDDTNLYIGYLPPAFDDDALIRLFSPFGEIVMAKVIKDRVAGLSKGYGFVKYSSVEQANSAITGMNGYRLDGRTIAVRVAGKPPQPPAIPPGPPTSSTPPAYPPAFNQAPPMYPSQQFTQGGYFGTPVPWGGPPVPPPYAPYPPPPGLTMYPHVPTQPMHPYGVQYPPQVTVSSTGPSQMVPSSEAPPSYPPGVQSQTSTSFQHVPINVGVNNVVPTPPTNQASYQTSPYTYPSYYTLAPPPPLPSSAAQPTADLAHGVGNVPWATTPPIPPSATSETNTYSTDAEYEKFMSETK